MYDKYMSNACQKMSDGIWNGNGIVQACYIQYSTDDEKTF
jgi:hypothetical protein